MLVKRHRIGKYMPEVVHPGPDPAALAVCRELVAETDVECVVLHGSRAWGNWDEQSDLDLIMIHQGGNGEEHDSLFESLELIKNRHYPGWGDDPQPEPSLLYGQDAVSPERYASRKRTLNDYMARAARGGLIFTRELGQERPHRHDGDTSNEWDLVTLKRLEMAGTWSRVAAELQDPELLAMRRSSARPRKDVHTLEGRAAHRVLGQSGAALLSTLGVVYPTASVEEMARLIAEHDEGWDHGFHSALGRIDQYAYCGCELVVTDPVLDLFDLGECLEADRSALWQRILELSGYDLSESEASG